VRTRGLVVGAALLVTESLSLSCGASGPKDARPTASVQAVLTTLTLALPASTIEVGDATTATVSGLDQNGSAISVGTVSWSTASAPVATISAAGVATGVAVAAGVGLGCGQRADRAGRNYLSSAAPERHGGMPSTSKL